MAPEANNLEHVTLQEEDIDAKVWGLAGIWMERKAHQRFSSKVFFTGIVTMFVLISLHNALNIYRLVIAFGYESDSQAQVLYLDIFSTWEKLLVIHPSRPQGLIIWIGDGLLRDMALQLHKK
ncbi:hypothetical protein BKA70DRAFT_1241863 [Coprinopsis sp. MPI-PUGE-AT-0042]|nr:hypothetical protein BKA70DRAFT_1241863 [Coprinopsis sp. MPI-PUGE-AT-0042]